MCLNLFCHQSKLLSAQKFLLKSVLVMCSLSALVISSDLTTSVAAAPLRIEYIVSFPQPQTHFYEITLRLGDVTAAQLDLALPTWTPGSYLQREYARNVQDFSAKDAVGNALRWQKTTKNNWRIETGSAGNAPRELLVTYRVYANELTVRTSHLDSSHAYFNGASIFMFVRGALNQPYRVKINAPASWRVVSPLALAPEADGFFTAPNFDILVDSPTEVGTHKLLEFDVRGKQHRLAIWGQVEHDAEKLKRDFAAIVEQGAQIFGGLPYEHYTFIAHFQIGAGGGLEHLNSTTLQSSAVSLKPRAAYLNFLSLVAHEYFHLWNVKRIRPQALGPFDYENENYTRALWFSEGLTDYYANQLLRRAGLMTPDEYLQETAKSIFTFEQSPGRFVQSAESASFDSWIKHYRPDENSPNSALSYYTRGELLGLLLDLEIRGRTSGAKSLDDVLRYLNETYAASGRGFPEAELQSAFEKIAGSDLRDFFARYVSGTDEIDFNRWLQLAGLQLTKAQAPTIYDDKETERGWLGFRTRNNADRVIISNVLADSPAWQGDINANDELIALNGLKTDAGNVNDRLAMLRAGDKVTVTVFRRDRLIQVMLTAAPKPPELYRLTMLKELNVAQKALLESWLRVELKQP
jgi:predicted metalloprotease with PDZ domain